MQHFADPYSDEGLANARAQIEQAHPAALAVGQDCYLRLGCILSAAEWERASADEATHTLAARVLELAATALRCLRLGSVPSAKALTRAILEATYKICAIKKEPSNLSQFIDDDIAARLLLNKQIHNYKKNKGSKSIAKGIEKKIDQLTLHKAKRIEPIEWATRAEMLDFHWLFYPWLSSDIHSNAAAMNHYFVEDEEYTMILGPSDVDLPMTLMILARCLNSAILALEGEQTESTTAWHANVEERLRALEAK